MRISVSDLKLYLTCPMMFYYSYVLKRVPAAQVATALGLGTVVHKVLESKVSGIVPELIFETPEVKEGYEALKPALDAWAPPAAWKIVEAETEVEYPVANGIVMVGRPDLVVEWNDWLWHVQYKTVASSVPVTTFGEVIRTDWHECFYHRALSEKHGRPVRGTILVTIRKLSARTIAAMPASAISVQYLSRDENTVDDAMKDMTELATYIRALSDGGLRFIKNRSACGGPFRNSLCGYKPVCDEGNLAMLAGPAFKEREERYGIASNEPVVGAG